jgi:hypothetical protein
VTTTGFAEARLFQEPPNQFPAGKIVEYTLKSRNGQLVEN